MNRRSGPLLAVIAAVALLLWGRALADVGYLGPAGTYTETAHFD
jgi:hypothetical protein